MGDLYENTAEKLLKENLRQNIETLIRRNLLEEAAEIIGAYEKIVRNDTEIISMKAVIAIEQHKLDTALEVLQEGLLLDSSNYDMLYNLGYVYEITGREELAEEFYKRAFVNAVNESPELPNDLSDSRLDRSAVKDKKIYICCPANLATGGTELLHQLCYKLNGFGRNAWMYYVGCKENQNPIHDRYEEYNNRYVTNLLDHKDQILISPEVVVNNDIFNSSETRKIIWWLSVDFFLEKCQKDGWKEKEWMAKLRKSEVIHFAQSQYAIDYLRNAEVDESKICYLSDYLNYEFIKHSSALRKKEFREPYILFNPKKGYDFTAKLIVHSPELNWLPLINYTPEEMRMIMNRGMVYVDFGAHPGKDRIPREAAICGCCIIVGYCGAAQNPIDIPIPDEFKIEKKEENIELVVSKIKSLLNCYDDEVDKFQKYRNMILNEEEQFDKDLYYCLDYLGR